MRTVSLVVIAWSAVTLAACSRCPPHGVEEVPAPDGQYVAATYARECGVMAPFNSFVGVRRVDEREFGEVVNIRDVGWKTNLRWLSKRELEVTFDCTEYHCGGRSDRYWAVDADAKWRDVAVTFAVTDRLRHALKPEDLARLPVRP